MKRLLFILSFFIFCQFSLSSAQEMHLYLGEEDVAKATEAMVKDLGLDAEQKKEVLKINKAYFKSFSDIEASDKLNPDERIREIVKITEKKDSDFSNVLNEDQLAIYEKKHHEAKAYGFKKITKEVQALQTDIRTYFDEHIRPALQQHRNTLDGHIDPEEKEEVAQIRKEIEKIHYEIDLASRHIMAEIVHGTPVPEEEKMMYDSLLILEEELFVRAEVIADGYGDEIDEVLHQIELFQKKWHDELEEIIGEHAGAAADQFINPAHFLHVKTQYLRAGFLLFDPVEPILPEEVVFQEKRGDNSITASILPNPGSRENMLEFTVYTDGKVNVDRYNGDGSFRKHIFAGHVDSGHYSIKVELEGEPEGSYFYLISAGEEHYMQRYLVKK